MSPMQPDLPVALPHISRRVPPDMPDPSRTDALQHVRALSHYRPDYDYRPDRFRYTETDTTDPDYVVSEVEMMSPTREHGEALVHMRNALHILVQASAADVHLSLDVDIHGIPGACFASARHTSTLRPDLSLWAGPPPAQPFVSYRYDRDGVPLLAVEVVSYTYPERRDHDWGNEMFAYARMGIREYWIVDEQLEDPLKGFTLDAADGTGCRLQAYRPIAMDADGGQDSMVLDTSLRWTAGDLQCRHADPASCTASQGCRQGGGSSGIV